jgi:hypothetical protein
MRRRADSAFLNDKIISRRKIQKSLKFHIIKTYSDLTKQRSLSNGLTRNSEVYHSKKTKKCCVFIGRRLLEYSICLTNQLENNQKLGNIFLFN